MTDYDELVSGTIEEAKKKIKRDDLDLQKVLKAEKRNKDRTTFVEWLEEEIGSAAEYTPASDAPSMGRNQLFISGVVVGVLLFGIFVFATGGIDATTSSSVTPAQAGTTLESFINDNSQDLGLPPGTNVSVTDVSRDEHLGMYNATIQLSIEGPTGSQERDVNAFMTLNGEHVFFAQPVDLEEPLNSQAS